MMIFNSFFSTSFSFSLIRVLILTVCCWVTIPRGLDGPERSAQKRDVCDIEQIIS